MVPGKDPISFLPQVFHFHRPNKLKDEYGLSMPRHALPHWVTSEPASRPAKEQKLRFHVNPEPALLKDGYEGNLQELLRGNLRICKYTKGYYIGENEVTLIYREMRKGESEKTGFI